MNDIDHIDEFILKDRFLGISSRGIAGFDIVDTSALKLKNIYNKFSQ